MPLKAREASFFSNLFLCLYIYIRKLPAWALFYINNVHLLFRLFLLSITAAAAAVTATRHKLLSFCACSPHRKYWMLTAGADGAAAAVRLSAQRT